MIVSQEAPTVLDISKLKKITTTEPQPHRAVLEYYAIFKHVANSFEPGETPGNSASNQAPNNVL